MATMCRGPISAEIVCVAWAAIATRAAASAPIASAPPATR